MSHAACEQACQRSRLTGLSPNLPVWEVHGLVAPSRDAVASELCVLSVHSKQQLQLRYSPACLPELQLEMCR